MNIKERFYTNLKTIREASEQHTATDIAYRKHSRAAAEAKGHAKALGKEHPDYETYMARYAHHRKKMMGEP